MENLRTGENSRPANPFNTGNTQVIPGDILYLDVDSSAVDWKNMAAKPTDKMLINLSGKQAVYRHELMVLELLTNLNDDNWSRPLYYATTITPSLYMNLQDHNFSLNGLAYQVVPGEPLNNGVNLEAAFDNMVNKFRWGGLENDPDIYMDQTSRRMLSTFRLYFTHLVDALVDAGENEKALTALDKITSMIPDSAVSYGTDGVIFARAYYKLGEYEKANELITEIHNRINANLNWFERLKPVQIANTMTDIIYNNVSPLKLVKNIYQQYDKEKYKLLTDDLLQRAQVYYMKGIPYVGDTILREITDSAVRGYYSVPSDDTIRRAEEEEIMQKAMGVMKQFNPRLLEQYSSSTQ